MKKRPSKARSGPRRQARELVLQMLFQADLGKQSAEEVRKSFWRERGEIDEEVRTFADDIFGIAMTRAAEIDAVIAGRAQNWRLERMPAVDRNLLRAAVAELLGYPDTASAIVINEAIEVAHKYSSPESVNFINGVLDAAAKELRK